MSQTKAQILQGKGTANTVEGLTASGIVTASAFDVGTTIQIGNAGVITATSLDVRTLGGDINVGGAVTISGNLRVDGTQTIVNTDMNIKCTEFECKHNINLENYRNINHTRSHT